MESDGSSSDEEDDILVRSPIRNTIRRQARQNARRRNGQEDVTYKRNWKQFKDFVDRDKRLQAPPYLTTDAVDLFFTTVIENQTITQGIARRYVVSLQYYADTDEHAGAPQKLCTKLLTMYVASFAVSREAVSPKRLQQQTDC